MVKNQIDNREQYTVPRVESITLEVGLGVCQVTSPGDPLIPEEYEFN